MGAEGYYAFRLLRRKTHLEWGGQEFSRGFTRTYADSDQELAYTSLICFWIRVHPRESAANFCLNNYRDVVAERGANRLRASPASRLRG